MEYRPCVVPAVALSESVTPLERVERRLEVSVEILTTHQLGLRIKEFFIVIGVLCKRTYLLIALAKHLAQAIDTPVIISVFKRAGGTLVDLHVVGYITYAVVVLKTATACRAYAGMHTVGTAHDCFPDSLEIMLVHSFQNCVSHYRSRAVAYHTSSVAGRSPFRQEAALLVSVGKTFLHLLVLRRINEIKKREETAECIPETGIGIHISWKNLAIVRAVMHYIAVGVNLPERTWEKHRAIKT